MSSIQMPGPKSHRQNLFHGASYGIACAASLLAIPGVATAADAYTLDTQLGVLHSDNVRRLDPPESSVISTAALSGSYRNTMASLTADLEGNATYRKFAKTEFGSDFLPQLRARLAWEPGAEYIRLVMEDNLGQIARSPADGLQPVDRENLNVASVGPDFIFEWGSAVRTLAQARYTRVDYGDSDTDNNRLIARIELSRELAGGGEALLSLLTGQTRFARSDLRSYDVQSATLGYRIGARRTYLQIDVGAGSAKNEGEPKTTGFDGALTVARRLSGRTSVFLSATRRFGDSADAFQIAQNLQNFVGDTVNVNASASVETQVGMAAGIDYQSRKLGLSAQVSQFKQEPIAVALPDRKTSAVDVSATYAFRPSFSVGLSAGTIADRSDSLALSGDDQSASIFIRWRAMRQLGIEISGERYKRTNSNRDFEEFRASVLATWRILDQAPARSESTDRWNVRRLRSGI